MEPLLKGLVFLFVLVVLVLCTVLALVWSMPGLHEDLTNENICLLTETGSIKCGKTNQLLYNYLTKVNASISKFLFKSHNCVYLLTVNYFIYEL